MTYSNKNIILSVIYRCPSQNNNEIDLCVSNFQKRLSKTSKRKSYLSVNTGDFNNFSKQTRFLSWCPKDINTTEGSKLFSLTLSKEFSQLINETTHIFLY